MNRNQIAALTIISLLAGVSLAAETQRLDPLETTSRSVNGNASVNAWS